MRALLAGGGTLGPVAPLLAVAPVLHARGWSVEFVGTPTGPEGGVVHAAGYRYHAVPVAKLSRGWSPAALKLPAHAVAALRVAARIVRDRKPSVVVGAGGFTQVPLAYAAAARRIPVVVHQQDVVPSLSNRLVAPVAAAITVSLLRSARVFPEGKVLVTGNPIRPEVFLGSRARGRRRFGLHPTRPALLVLGGGTGALALNRAVTNTLALLLPEMDVLHLTGTGRMLPASVRTGYVPLAVLREGMGDAFAATDAVLCRSGFSTLSEVVQLDAPVLTVPLPRSHQEANARAFAEAGAVLTVDQGSLLHGGLPQRVRELLTLDRGALRTARLAFRWDGAAVAVADVVEGVLR